MVIGERVCIHEFDLLHFECISLSRKERIFMLWTLEMFLWFVFVNIEMQVKSRPLRLNWLDYQLKFKGRLDDDEIDMKFFFLPSDSLHTCC